MIPNGQDRKEAKKKLRFVFALTVAFFFVELVAGFLTGSLALLSDAGHMLTDVLALSISFIGFKIAENKRTNRQTYGFQRAEILSAFANGLLLFGLSFFIVYEAIHRLKNPPVVKSLEMSVVALTGLIINVISGLILFPQRKFNLNLRSAYLHIISDALGSISAFFAGIVMTLTGWYYADIIASLVISLIIIFSSFRLLRDSANILMEGAPPEIDVEDVAMAIREIPEVATIHDLHIWTLTSGYNILTAHIGVKGEIDRKKLRELLNTIEYIIKERTDIEHITIQIESITHDAELDLSNFKILKNKNSE